MTKRDQVVAVARVSGITVKQARAALDAVAAAITVSLLEDERATLSGLGTFVVHRRRPRRVRNPATGVMMELPASASVSFKASPELRDLVKERHA